MSDQPEQITIQLATKLEVDEALEMGGELTCCQCKEEARQYYVAFVTYQGKSNQKILGYCNQHHDAYWAAWKAEQKKRVADRPQPQKPFVPTSTNTFSDYQAKAHETAIYPSALKMAVQKLEEMKQTKAAAAVRLAIDVEPGPKNPYYLVIGMGGEVGELQNKVKKILRDNGGRFDDEARRVLKPELGGVLWYLSEFCTDLGIDLGGVAAQNLALLKSRAERGKLQGSGDER